MDDNAKLNNINKDELKVHSAKLLELHDIAIGIIENCIKKFCQDSELEDRVKDLMEFRYIVVGSKEHFTEWGVEGIAQDIESFPYECLKATLPHTVTIGGDTRFWELYDQIQDVSFEEREQYLPPTIATIWAIEIKKAIDNIRNYYYHEVIKSQLSRELLNELENCLEHFFKLWDKAIDEIDKAIEICENDEEQHFEVKNLKIAKRNMESRREAPRQGRVGYLIYELRTNPISESEGRGTLDIFWAMEGLIGRSIHDDHWTHPIQDAVGDICSYYRTGFGFRYHKRFDYEKWCSTPLED